MNKIRNLMKANAKRGSFRAEANTIYLYDMIVGDDWEAEMMGGVSPKAFIDALKASVGDVLIRINSPGGDVFGANAMAQAMREYQGGKITCMVDGVAASAASLIAISGSQTKMAPGALLMIYNAWTFSMGDRNDMLETAALLEKIDGMLADNYAAKASTDSGTFAAMMDAETWLTPQEAVDCGLCDAIAEMRPQQAPAAAAKRTIWDLSVFKNAAPVTTRTTTTTTCTEVEEETVEVISGDPSTLPPEDSAATKIQARNRRLAVDLLSTPA